MYWREHLNAFYFLPGSTFCSNSFCIHLWEALTWPLLEHLAPIHILLVDSEFSRLMGKYVQNDEYREGEPEHRRNADAGRRLLIDRFGLDGSVVSQNPRHIIDICRQAIARLETREREVFTACTVCGLSPSIAAMLLGITADDLSRTTSAPGRRPRQT